MSRSRPTTNITVPHFYGHWGACFQKYFTTKGQLSISKTNFQALFNQVIDARNAICHHRPVSGLERAIATITRLTHAIAIDVDTEVDRMMNHA